MKLLVSGATATIRSELNARSTMTAWRIGTPLAKLERVLNKAHARLLRRWQAQVAREMNEYEAARLAKLLEVPSDGRRF